MSKQKKTAITFKQFLAFLMICYYLLLLLIIAENLKCGLNFL